MTKETIIKSTLKYLVKRQIEEGSVGFAVDNDHDHDCCWDDVLAWIEAQPCEDCISREAVLEHICEDKECYKEECKGRTLKRCYDLQWVFDLPSVTPERPKGKWMEYKVDIAPHPLHCSLCGFSNHHISNRYMKEFRRCPNCGAEMSGGKEDEASD